jgi:hypothetical protein
MWVIFGKYGYLISRGNNDSFYTLVCNWIKTMSRKLCRRNKRCALVDKLLRSRVYMRSRIYKRNKNYKGKMGRRVEWDWRNLLQKAADSSEQYHFQTRKFARVSTCDTLRANYFSIDAILSNALVHLRMTSSLVSFSIIYEQGHKSDFPWLWDYGNSIAKRWYIVIHSRDRNFHFIV